MFYYVRDYSCENVALLQHNYDAVAIYIYKRQYFTYSKKRELFKECPAVIVDAVVLQDKHLAYVSGSDVIGNLDGSTGVVFIINFDDL